VFEEDVDGGYKSFSLLDLKQKIMIDLGRNHFILQDFTDEVNCARYARILFYIG